MRYLATYLIYVAVIARAIGWNFETASIPTAIWILLGIFGAFLLSQQALTRRFPLLPAFVHPGPVGPGHCHALPRPDPGFSADALLSAQLSSRAVLSCPDRLCLDRSFQPGDGRNVPFRHGMAGGADHAPGLQCGQCADGQLRSFDGPHRAETAGEPAFVWGPAKGISPVEGFRRPGGSAGGCHGAPSTGARAARFPHPDPFQYEPGGSIRSICNGGSPRSRPKNISSACKLWRAMQPAKCRLSPDRSPSVLSPREGWRQPSTDWQSSGWHRMDCR